MGCAASVPDEDKKNRKKGGKGKEPAEGDAPKVEAVVPAATTTTTTTTTTEPAAPAAEPAKPAAEPAAPAQPAVEPAKPAEPEAPKVEEHKPVAEAVVPAVAASHEEKKEEVKSEEHKPAEVVVKPEEVNVEHKSEAPKEEPKAGEVAHGEAQAPKNPKIAVIYYSTYGHITQLAEVIAEGVKKSGAHVDIFQIRETLPDEVLEKMHAPPKASHPTIELATTLTEYDGFLFGIPTRYGVWPGQWKTFLDATGQVWQSGGLHGRFGGVFTSTASQHGGVETTAFNALTFFTHHGVNFVPLGYAKAFPQLTIMTEVMGASPYGAGTIAGGDGSRQPSELEKSICLIQGEYFANIVKKNL